MHHIIKLKSGIYKIFRIFKYSEEKWGYVQGYYKELFEPDIELTFYWFLNIIKIVAL